MMRKIIIPLAALIIFSAQQSMAQLNNHANIEKNSAINLYVSNNCIDLSASDNDKLQSCKGYLELRVAGTEKWSEDFSTKIEVIEKKDSGIKIRYVFPDAVVDATIIKIEGNKLEFSGTIKNTSSSTIQLARFHYLDGTLKDTASMFLGMSGKLVNSKDEILPFRSETEKIWSGFNVFWPRLQEPISDQKNWAVSTDVGFLLRGWRSKGWLIGYFGPGVAFGEIGFMTKTIEPRFFSAVLLDNIVMEPNETRVLEKFIVAYGDWQNNLNDWVVKCAQEKKVTIANVAPVAGYCSWYQSYNNITPKEFNRAIKEFADMPPVTGGRIIQLDDGFQKMPGDWRPNNRFDSIWLSLPAEIKKTGSIPGIWLAPSAIFERWPKLNQYDDALQKLPNGRYAVSFCNWGWSDNKNWYWGDTTGKTYFLDPDHPKSIKLMTEILKQVKLQGWKYYKFDFTYALSTARNAYDKKKTRFQTLSDLFTLFRTELGNDVMINACIGEPGRYALGKADIARMGGDMGNNWSSIRNNLRELFLRMSTNGYWWQGDPDVFNMVKENSELNDEEKNLLTTTIGLMGGVFMTSDYPSQWSVEAKKTVLQFWDNNGAGVPKKQRISFDKNGVPETYCFSYINKNKAVYAIAIYNWKDEASDNSVSLSDLGFTEGIKWKVTTDEKPQSIQLANDNLSVTAQPAHSIRVIYLKE